MLRHSSSRSPLVALVLALFVLGGVTVVDAHNAEVYAQAGAATWELAAETEILAMHNAHRAANGLEALVRDPSLDAVARDWTSQMATGEVLSHRTDLRQQVESNVTTEWRRIGENVGWGPSPEWLHDAFVDSPGHNANILGNYNRVGIGAALDDDGDLWVTLNFLDGPELAPEPPIPAADPVDAWIVDDGGVIATTGSAPHLGDLASVVLTAPIVGMSPTPSGNGYWLVATDGGIFAFGDAGFHGSTGHLRLNQPIVGMSPTPSGNGYWLVATDGGIFAFGDAGFHGSTGHLTLNQPIVGMAATTSGDGYWMVASDGGIFAFGDAGFHGSTGNITLNEPIVAMATTTSGNGYWLVAHDGGVFTFGDAEYHGAPPAMDLHLSAVTLASSNSEVEPVGDAPQYWIFDASGRALAFGAGT
ncbi:MAG: CAP domain-containing protein, partial [Actinomycetota bacterium]|nr:CAP domain-containing protein [Actinomycetota bacterium]